MPLLQVVIVFVNPEFWTAKAEKCQENGVRLAWGIPRLNAQNENWLLVDIMSIFNLTGYF